MALPRLDIRAKLDPEWHDALIRVAKRDGLDLGELVEKMIVKALRKRLHDYRLDQEHFGDLPQAGQKQAPPGKGH